MEILQKVLTILFVINCVLLILLILLQSNRSAGMNLFGGGGSQSAFGSSSGNVLTKTTGVMTTVFLLLGLTIAWLGTGGSSKIQELQKEFIEDVPIKDEQNSNLQGKNRIKDINIDDDNDNNKKNENFPSKQNNQKTVKP